MQKTESSREENAKIDKSAENIVEDCMEYEEVGKYLLCPLEDIVERENEDDINDILLYIDTPFGEDVKWIYKKPYRWDGFFATLAENHNYGRGNFHEMIGDEMLVWYDNENNCWNLSNKTEQQLRKDEGTELDFASLAVATIVPLLYVLTIILIVFVL